jgi:hypothetical protein
MRGGEEHAAATALSLEEVFQPFITDPASDVAGMEPREPREGHQQARNGSEDAVDDGLVIAFRIARQLEISARRAA